VFDAVLDGQRGMALWYAWRLACAMRVSLEDILPTGNAPV
jgi:hypothetical protein